MNRQKKIFFICIVFLIGWSSNVFAQSEKSAILIAEGDSILQLVNPYMQADSIVLLAKVASGKYEQAERWDKYVHSLVNLSNAYLNKGEWKSGFILAQEASLVSEEHLPVEDPNYLNALHTLATFYDINGEYDEAIKWFLKTLEIDEQIGTSATNKSISYGNLGYTYYSLGDLNSAIAYTKKGISFHKDSVFSAYPYLLTMHWQLAFLYDHTGQLDSVYAYANKGLELTQAASQTKYVKQILLYYYQELANYFIKVNDLSAAFSYLQKALEQQSKDSYLFDFRTHELMGDYYTANGQPEKAILKYKESFQKTAIEYKDYDQHQILAKAKAKLAKAYGAEGSYEASLASYNKALQLNTLSAEEWNDFKNPLFANIIDYSVALTTIQNKLSLLKQMDSSNEPAWVDYQIGAFHLLDTIVRHLRHAYPTEASKYELAENAVNLYEQSIDRVLHKALNMESDEEALFFKAFQFAERNKANEIMDYYEQALTKGNSGIPDSMLKRERNLKIERNHYRELLAINTKFDRKGEQGLFEEKIRKLQQELESLKLVIQEGYPAYPDAGLNEVSLNLTTIRDHLLDEQTALIEYFVGTDNIFVFCISKDQVFYEKIPAAPILFDQIIKFREAVSTEPAPEEYAAANQLIRSLGSELFEKLIFNSINQLSSDINRLIIVPDDVLSYLPFELLCPKPIIEGEKNALLKFDQFLLNEYAISYAFSAGLLLQVPQLKRQPVKTFLGVAPSFGQEGQRLQRSCLKESLSRLACNGKEVKGLMELLSGQVWLDEQANAEEFQEAAGEYGILHLATHACVNDEAGLSQIFFTDDYLTDFDLNLLSLNASMVVLSACNTGMGYLQKGEGVMSLARSFTLAGAGSLISSLWPVDDCSTADLMSGIYAGLADDLPKDQALQLSKKSFFKQASPAMRHPYFWGGFVLNGDTSALDFSQLTGDRTFSVGSVLVMTLLAFFSLFILWRLFFRKE